MSAYADEERRIVLLRVFRAYDDAGKGLLEVAAFSNLIADLHSLVSATGSASVVVKDKPEDFMKHLGLTNGHVTLDNFYNGVKMAPVHCDGKQTYLLQVLVDNADQLIELHADRIGGGTTFAPTYNYKKVLACQEPLSYTGLDIKFELAVGGGHKTARIPDPMQAWMSIPTFGENVRVFASRGDDVSPGGSLACKVVTNWPSGGKGHSLSPPDPHTVYFVHDGRVLEGTVESCKLFFIHKQVEVQTDGPPVKFMALQKNPLKPPMGAGYCLKTPIDDEDEPSHKRTDSMADRYEDCMKNFRKLEKTTEQNFKKLREIDEECLKALDELGSIVLDNTDTKGLKDGLRELRARLAPALQCASPAGKTLPATM